MYLKRLELHGFKSFADKTVLEFMPGITSVIGPNGSGKSNISDAIRWVLGEQSMKSLRGAKSEDIIFAGTQNRKSLGFAETSIVIDNSDSKLPIEYAEVTVTRRIYRSGETGYFINKTPCRLKDILELFMDTGIGRDGYSIIGQGKIDEILSNKSEDRRNIFEEAAGIVKYRARKTESEKKLEQTKLNLLRINDILTEIEGNIEPLKLQSEKAKKFLDLREELKSIEIGLFLYNIETYQSKIEEIIKDQEILQSGYDDEQAKMLVIQGLKEELKQAIDAITNEIEETQNLGFESSKKKEIIHSEIKVAKERISNNAENVARYQNEIEEAKTRTEQLAQEKQQKLDRQDNLNNNKEKFQKELEQKEKELKELSEKLSEKELEIEDKKQTVEKNIDLKYERMNQIATEQANYENLEKREKTVKTEIQTQISELDQTRMVKEDIAKEFYEIEAKRNQLTKALEEVADKKTQSTTKLKEYDETLNKLTYELRMKDSRCKFLMETEKEKEGYSKSVKTLLLECEKNADLNKGVHGVLANLVRVPQEYQVAIEMCLGGALQNIVTETEKEAKKLIEHLRQNNLGRASFLPISSVKGKKIDRVISNGISGISGVASDLVKADKKYEEILLNLLGRTVIVDDMDNAIALAKQNSYSFRIVTLKGDVINPSGAITGGSVNQKTVNILGRAAQIETLEKEIKVANEKIATITKEKEEYSQSIEGILEEIEGIEKSLQEMDIEYATKKQRLVSIEENIGKLEERLTKYKEEIATIASQKQAIIQIKEEKELEITNITKETEELTTVINQYAELNRDDQKYRDDLNFDITNLRISVSSFDESKASMDEMITRINQDIENNQLGIENKEKQLELIYTESKELKTKIEQLESQIITMDEEVATSSNKVEGLKEQRQKKNEELNKTEENTSTLFKTIEGLKEQIVKVEVKKAKIEQELEVIINRMWEEYELTPNNAGEYSKPENIQTTTKRVNTLRNEIKELGSINIDAIEEYKQVKTRYDFMSEQKIDLEESVTKLRKVIQDMTGIMKEQFAEQFKIINKNFDEVFKELFGGGKAELILTDEENILECGIDIQVQPVGKKLQNMMLLSGGEKALTAIALLFAILKINPAPFCVLDEIEAALDDVNVYRFADYLRKFSKHTQFLLITHRKGTMEVADTVYGITMQENGISKLLSMKLKP